MMAKRLIDFLTIRTALERAWDITTTFCPERYDGADQATGQCKVTAVYLHDLTGAELWQGEVNGFSHAWVVLHGIPIDFTWRQFKAGSVVNDPRRVTRDELLKQDWAKNCYENLKNRMK